MFSHSFAFQFIMIYKTANKLIKKIFEEDQKDRLSKKLLKYSKKKRWEIISSRDKIRLERIKDIIKKIDCLRGVDYFRAGIIAQHSSDEEGIKLAKFLAKKGIGKNHKKSKWLHAAATDRLLIMKGKKQKYGTQYGNSNGKWFLLPVDSNTTDKERLKYNVITLKEATQKAEKLNNGNFLSKKKIGIASKR